MRLIHPTAIVDETAELADDVQIGPYSIVGKNVKLHSGVKIGSHVVLVENVEIGQGTCVYTGCVIGEAAQHRNYRGEKTWVIIGQNNIIREYVTIHRAVGDDQKTIIGNDCFIMASAHIAHNCVLENRVTVTNYAGLTGHVLVEDDVVISGLAAIHQFVRIGRLAMVGGGSKVVQDVPPFMLVDGHPARVYGLNFIGLQRAGIPPAVRLALKKAYKLLFFSNGKLNVALEHIQNDLPPLPEIIHLVEFIRQSKRGICHPKRCTQTESILDYEIT